MPRKAPTPAAAAGSPPSDDDVRALLGRAHAAFLRLTQRQDGSAVEWKKYTKNSPWVLRVAAGKRTLFYVRPVGGACDVTVILGERAVAAALAGGVAETLHEAIRQARAFVEGRPVLVTVRTLADASLVEQLLRVKLA